jgi:hypothetical protein
VGSTELESVTSCVSSRRSNQLSYEPSKRAKELESNDSADRSPPGVQSRKVEAMESKWRPNRTPVNHSKPNTGTRNSLISCPCQGSALTN